MTMLFTTLHIIFWHFHENSLIDSLFLSGELQFKSKLITDSESALKTGPAYTCFWDFR
jgi:hypothetical protein